MKTNAEFWDTSAIVPLCVKQNATRIFRARWRKSSAIVVWWGTAVEVRSALSRLRGENLIDANGLQFALVRLEAMRKQWREILPNDKMREIAELLPDAYGLRALDSFQLAAALIWCREKPKNRVFVCDDVRLTAAALKTGFVLKP